MSFQTMFRDARCCSRVEWLRRWAIVSAMLLGTGVWSPSVSAAPQSAAELNRERFENDVAVALDAGKSREERRRAAVAAVQRGERDLGMTRGQMAIEVVKDHPAAGGKLLVLAAEASPAPSSIDWKPVFEELRSEPAVGVAVLKAMKESPTVWPADGWKGVVGRIGMENTPRTSVVVGQNDERDVMMEFILVGPGVFQMGASQREVDQVLEPDHPKGTDQSHVLQASMPAHWVELTGFFWLGRCEVTQEQWQSVMDANPSRFKGNPKHPVEQVSWIDAQEFCRRLSETIGKSFRLPTEAEWEYACRAGTTTAWSFGETSGMAAEHAWYLLDVRYWEASSTKPVARKQPNPWGFHDMHGNVCEWVADGWYLYSADARQDPAAAVRSNNHVVLRGGGILCTAGLLRSCLRMRVLAEESNIDRGFRVVMELRSVAAASATGGTPDQR